MNEPYRTQFEVLCAFNGFCKKVLRCEASNAWRDVRNRQLREISFSNLSPEEEAQLYTTDTYAFDEADKSFFFFFCCRKELYRKATCRRTTYATGRKAQSGTAVLLL